MELPEWLTPHKVKVALYLGDSATGPAFADPVECRAYSQDSTQLVRTAAGKKVTATGMVALPLSEFDVLTAESRVTVRDVTRTAVLVKRHEFGEATPNHWEVWLT